MRYISIDGKDYPYKKTNRAITRIEDDHKIRMSGTTDLSYKQSLVLVYESIKEGLIIENRTAEFPWKSMDEMLAADAIAEESFINEVINGINEDEKKPIASSKTGVRTSR